MKTQIEITSKGNWLMNYMNHTRGFFSKEHYIGLYIDKDSEQGGELIKLVPRKTPYIIDIKPGSHQFFFVDSTKQVKKLFKLSMILGLTIADAAFMAGVGAGVGSAITTGSAAMDVEARKKTIEDNYMYLTLQEGDYFKFLVKPTNGGKIKIKEIN